MAEKKYLWKLQIFWANDWRTILEADKRTELVEYAQQCPEDLELRIIDTTTEEVKAHGRRRH